MKLIEDPEKLEKKSYISLFWNLILNHQLFVKYFTFF